MPTKENATSVGAIIRSKREAFAANYESECGQEKKGEPGERFPGEYGGNNCTASVKHWHLQRLVQS
jgi:hypothetical protein